MFDIGDKVVYPMHGAGIIESIEEKEILGEKRRYYVMKIPVGNMKVMIPMDNVGSIGLREVADQDVIGLVESILQNDETPMSTNWNQRYRANMDKIRSGDIVEVADVVRNLVLRERQKGLSTGERKMLDNARQILVSEIVLAKEMIADDAYVWLEDTLGNKNASM
jgi:CarD family transcriptional regulator